MPLRPLHHGLDAALRDTFDHMLEGIQVVDAEYRYRYLNATAARHGQRTVEELIGHRMTEMYPGIEQTPVFASITRCLTQRESDRLLNEFTFPDGSTGWFEVRITPLPAGALIMSLDVTEQKRAEASLRMSITALEQAERRRTELLTMLAHELRNPVASLSAGIHVMLARATQDDRVTADAGQAAERQIRHLTRLVDDLLDTTRVAHGLGRVIRERTDIARVVREAVADQAAAFERREIAVHVRVPATPVWVDGDPVRLAQVIGNVLDNARKFTDPPHEATAVPTVTVEVTAVGPDRMTITVGDSGIGIAADALPFVFDPLYQADRSLDRARGGVGVGLTVSRAFVELHGGSIEVASDGAGLGTTVRIDLPRLAEPIAVRSEPPLPGTITTDAPGGEEPGAVLVIEDNLDAARTLSSVLHLWGYDVQLAHSGPEGVSAARMLRPDIVLCDIGLPGMDGYAVARALRGTAETRHARMIAITGYGSAEDAALARDAGFDVHLSKPVDPRVLRARLVS